MEVYGGIWRHSRIYEHTFSTLFFFNFLGFTFSTLVCFFSLFLEVYRPWEVSHLFSRQIASRMHSESCLGTPWGPRYKHLCKTCSIFKIPLYKPRRKHRRAVVAVVMAVAVAAVVVAVVAAVAVVTAAAPTLTTLPRRRRHHRHGRHHCHHHRSHRRHHRHHRRPVRASEFVEVYPGYGTSVYSVYNVLS